MDESLSNLKGNFPLNEFCVVERKPPTSKRKFLFLLCDSSTKSDLGKLLMNAPDNQTCENWISKLGEVIEFLSGNKQGSTLNDVVQENIHKGSVDDTKTIKSSLLASTSVSGSHAFVMKSKVVGGKVFVNVLFDSGVPVNAVIVGNECPHQVADKEGKLSDTYDVCINEDSKSDNFNRMVSEMHIRIVDFD